MKQMTNMRLELILLIILTSLIGCSSTSFSNKTNSEVLKEIEQIQVVSSSSKSNINIEDMITNQLDGIPALDVSFDGVLIFRYPISSEFFSMEYEEPFIYYLYLLITDKVKHKTAVDAAIEAYMCNFSNKKNSNLDELEEIEHFELLPFIVPIKDEESIQTSMDLKKRYNTAIAKVIHSHLGDEFEKETVMVVGTSQPINVQNLLSIKDETIVLGLSNLSAKEVVNNISNLNNAAINATSIEEIKVELKLNKEDYLSRAIKEWFRKIGKTVLTNNSAVASEC